MKSLFTTLIFSALPYFCFGIDAIPTKTHILLGVIRFGAHIDTSTNLPIFYKGGACYAKIEPGGDTKKAHFELFEHEKIREIFIFISEAPTLPSSKHFQHFKTSNDYPYRLFKCTLLEIKEQCNEEKKDNNPEAESRTSYLTWNIEECKNSIAEFELPDNTIMLLGMDPVLIDKMENFKFEPTSNIIRLPVITLKGDLSKKILEELAEKMNFAAVDFMPFHKKVRNFLAQCGQNHLISMPTHSFKSKIHV